MDLDILRNLCMALPAATEEVKWGADLVFSVGGRMFCVAATDGPAVFSVKVPPEAFDEWCTQPGVVPAPYLARAGWVQFTQPGRLSGQQLSSLVTGSYSLVSAKLTKKQKQELGLV